MQSQSLSKDTEGRFKNNIDNIVSKILLLEENPELKSKTKLDGSNYILENFNINKIGKMWTDFVNELIK